MNNKAFTLIELLVTIGIVALLMAVSLPSFTRYGHTNEMKHAVDSITSIITEAQTLALAPPTEKKRTHNSYMISISSTKYQISAGTWLGIAEGGLSEDFEVIKSIDLPSNITIGELNGKDKIVYSIANQGRIIYPTSGTIELPLKHNKLNKQGENYKIIVNIETGQIITEKY